MSITELSRSLERMLPANGHSHQRPRRLMFVIEALTVGGAERMVVDLANEFSRRGDIVSVVCLSSIGELAESLSDDVSLHLLNKKPGVDLRVIGRLRKIVLQQRVEVVNSHLWTANLWTRLALYRHSIPVVITEHNRDVWKRLHNKLIDRVLSYFTARLIAVSEDTASFYRYDVGINGKLVCVVNNGVDTQRYASGRGEFLRCHLASELELLVGTVGRLAVQKNHLRLVQAAAILKAQGLPVRIVIAGDGPEREAIEACITEHDVAEYVNLLGERSDIPDLLAALDVFVLSSDREGYPLAALEAQSAGTPVVLTNAGGCADAISQSASGCGGLLVDKTPEAIATAIAELAMDRQRLLSMGEFACKHASQHFDKRTMIDRYSEIFDDVVPGPLNPFLLT
ncbi:MAG: glycosyltransferase [Granulosicoccus sp.]